MLGSFDDLERDLEKFKNNIMASNELIESLKVTTQAIKSQTDTIAEQTAIVDRVSMGVPDQVAKSNAETIKQIIYADETMAKMIIDSNELTSEKIVSRGIELQSILERVPAEMKEFLMSHQLEITEKNSKYLKECASSFEKKQQEYIEQLKNNSQSLDNYKKQLEADNANFINKVEKLDFDVLIKSVEALKLDVSKKFTIIMVVSILGLIAGVVRIFM